MSILITGATGMLGAYLLKQILENNTKENICLTYRSDEKKQLTLDFLKHFNISEHQLTGLIWKKGDLQDICFVEECIENDMVIYHCAAVVSFNKKDADAMIKTNISVTENIVNSALGKTNVYLLHVSSIAAIGRENIEQVVSETSQWTNSSANSAYAISKYLSEMEVWRGFEEGLKGSVINPSIILGVFPKSISSLKLFDLARSEFPFYSTGENGFVDVVDITKSMILLQEKREVNTRFIISAGNYSYQKIMNGIASGLDKKPPKYKTTLFLGRIALGLELLKVIFGKKRELSLDLLKTSLQKNHYDNKKFINTFDFKYKDIDESIMSHCQYYKSLL